MAVDRTFGTAAVDSAIIFAGKKTDAAGRALWRKGALNRQVRYRRAAGKGAEEADLRAFFVKLDA